MLGRWRQLGSERAIAAVEMALVLPILLLLIFGTIEIGRFYWAEHSLVHAVNEGARLAVLADVTSEDVNRVVAFHLRDWDPSVTPVVAEVAATADTPAGISVTATIPFHFILLPDFVADAFGIESLTHSVTMRSER